MEGLIAAFRGSHKTQYGNHFIVLPEGVDNREKATGLEGKKVAWKNPEGKNKVVISGYVSKAHGGKGAVRVVFERGLPGQALGTKVEIA
jgi:large subunit ribosomal protein L35Ae